MKKLFLFIFLIFSSFNVFAQDFNVDPSKVTSPIGGGRTGTYTGTEIYNTGTSTAYNIGTRYSGRLSRIIFNLASGGYADPNGFEKGHTYTLTLNMATDDWRNNFGSVSVSCESLGSNLSNGRVTYISYKKIKFSFTTPTDRWCQFVYVDLKSTNISNVAFTGVSNWNLSSMVISDPYYTSGGSSGGSSTPTPTPQPNNQDIINNQNQNTQNIINNNNQNTQNVINNQNQNTNDIIENANENTNKITESIDNINYICKKSVNKSDIKFTRGAYLQNNGSLVPTASAYYYTSDFIKVSGDSITFSNITGTNYHLLFYNSNRELIQNGSAISATSYNLPSGTNYIRFSLDGNNYESFTLSSNGCIYLDRDSITNNKLEDINESINNDNVDDKTGFFTNFQNDTHGLTGIITLPLTTIQSLTNSSCVSLAIPIPFTNSNVNLPCMTEVYQTYIPSVYSIWQVVSFGIISYFICLDIFKMVKGFKDPNEDKIEVLDL